MWRRTILVAALAALLPLQSEQLDGAERRTQLLELLSESEKIFLFGPDTKDVTFELVSYKQTRRRKRFAAALARSGDDPGSALVGRLRARAEPRERFLDPHFLLLRRWSNRSEPLLDLPYEEDFDGCFYRSESAALFICGDIRGIVTANKKDYYFIHPLPERFHVDHNKIHVVVKRSTTRKKTLEINREENSDDDHFCVERNPTDKITENPATKRMWTKHRRKHGQNETSTPQTSSDKLERFKLDFLSRNKSVDSFLEKLSLEKTKLRKKRAIQSAIFVETAVFVDRDLYKHMTVNFPKDTERELVRFVLAMINAVQLLYHDPSLGRPVNFILKRLEILHEDPANLKRPHDIDRFLSNFCTWQRLENPPGDSDPLHWDHALILTGLDLYVVSKNGKVSSQVVGLAPVAGMCTVTSSCTVNEGRHFESVYVVAHEIGHNLGMRHDGPLADNGCDPTAYIMSPTLGSGKITWSGCSKSYLQKFLDTAQSRCLLDHASSAGQLDHSAEGILPGERFDADQQCMLKYGRGSRHAVAQGRQDVCRDLHCQRERYTWTSHPALEGTECGDHSWCRSGECVARAAGGGAVESAAGAGGGGWGRWSAWSECASGCLYGAEGRLLSGSTGVAVATRRCSRPRHEAITKYCSGPDKKFQSCHAQQCLNVPRVTVREFADQLCQRARELDPDLIGTGLQRMDSEDVGGGGGGGGGGACAVWCHTRGGGYKSRGWSLPDGTTCSRSRPMYCIAGTCQKFGCSAGSGEETEYSLRPGECEWEAQQLQAATPAPPAPSTASPSRASSGTWRRAVGSQWRPASGCHYHCVSPGTGIRLVRAGGRPAPSIQLCRPDERTADLGCSQKKSPFQYATMVCSRYKERVRRLSGLGMQISPALEEPDRPCRVACQDERVSHRFYLVNGHEGWFPLGTSCRNASSYCVSGKCLEFGPDDTPVSEMVFTLPLISRSNLTAGSASAHRPRPRRSLEPERRVVTATLTRDHLHRIIAALNITENGHDRVGYFDIIPENIEVDFNHPIHIAPEETLYGKIPKPGEGWL